MGKLGGGLSPLPNWVRTPHRVALWVQAKMLILELEKAAVKNKDLCGA